MNSRFLFALCGVAIPALQSELAWADPVDEVVVTARLRPEPLTRTPLAITAIAAQDLAGRNINTLQDLAQIVPELDFRPGISGKDTTLFVRGVGTITSSQAVDPSVSTVIDGVVMAHPGQATLDLLDLKQVEILRGPQGTLFGKNASAGVVNIVTDDPRETPGGFFDASYFDHDEVRFKASATGAIVPGKLDGLVSLMTGRYGGQVASATAPDRLLDGYRRDGVLVKLLARPTDALRLTVEADDAQSYDSGAGAVYVSTSREAYPSGAVTTAPSVVTNLIEGSEMPRPDSRLDFSSQLPDVSDHNQGVSLHADYALQSGAVITSITAYRVWKNHQTIDFDGLPATSPLIPQQVDDGLVRAIQRSQELRLTSPQTGRLHYVAGLFYLDVANQETYQRTLAQIEPAPAFDLGVADFGSGNQNASVYGEGDLEVVKGLRVILGGRAIHDRLDYDFRRVSTSAMVLTGIRPDFASAGGDDVWGWSGRVGLQYDLGGGRMAYVTASRGYKGPAYNVYFNMQAADEPALAPETSSALEFGVKGGVFDNKLRGSLDVYDTVFDNYQANFFDLAGSPPAIVTRLVNAGRVTSRGVEGDIAARPVQGLQLSLSVAWNEATIDAFTCPLGAPVSCDINGEPLPFAPRWKMHAEVRYGWMLPADWRVEVSADHSWTSDIQYSLSETPDTIQRGYGILNAGLALIDTRRGWSLRGVVKNIADQSYAAYLTYPALIGVVRAVPRDDRRYAGVILHIDF
jgi:iron complex outermembrane recepter protein